MMNKAYIYFNGSNLKQTSEIGISQYISHFGAVGEDLNDLGYVLSMIGRTDNDDPAGIESVGDVGVSDIYLSVIEGKAIIGYVG